MRKSEIEAKLRRIAFDIKFTVEMLEKVHGPEFKDVITTIKKAGDEINIALVQLYKK